MGKSPEKRARQAGKQVDGGHPKSDPNRPTGKSHYATKQRASNAAFLTLLEGEQAATVPTKTLSTPPKTTVNVESLVSTPANDSTSINAANGAKNNDAIEYSTATPTSSVLAATSTLDERRRVEVINSFKKLPKDMKQALVTELTCLAEMEDPKVGIASPHHLKKPNSKSGYSKALENQNSPFARECLAYSIEKSPLHPLDENEERRFQTTLAEALHCRDNNLAMQNANYAEVFPSLLGDYFLHITVHRILSGEQFKRAYAFLVDETSPNTFVLKPHIADAIETMARECIRQHGHLIGTHFSRLGPAH